jgi:hypothetical protein
MNHLTTQFLNNLDNYYDSIQKHKEEILSEYKNDKEQKYENLLTQKLSILDTILKNFIKYKNVSNKEKKILEKNKLTRLLGKT